MNSTKNLVKDTLLILIFLYLSAFVGTVIYSFWNGFFVANSHVPQIRFPVTTLIRLSLIILSMLLYVRHICRKRPDEITPGYLGNLAIAVAISVLLITIAGIYTYIHSIAMFIILIIVFLLFLWLFYTVLIFGHFLFNKKAEKPSGIMIFSFIVAPLLVIASLLLSTNRDNTKDEWSKMIEPTFTVNACESLSKDPEGKKILASKNLDKDQCVIVVRASFHKCLSNYSNDIPDMLNSVSGGYWARKIGACMDQDLAAYFNTDFFLPKARK